MYNLIISNNSLYFETEDEKFFYQENKVNTNKLVEIENVHTSDLSPKKKKKKLINLIKSINKTKTGGVIFMELEDNWRWKLLQTKEEYVIEGKRMSHCVKGYGIQNNRKIYSLRNAEDYPHVTMEIKNKNVTQVYGKGNQKISDQRYINMTLKFIEFLVYENFVESIETSYIKKLAIKNSYHHIL